MGSQFGEYDYDTRGEKKSSYIHNWQCVLAKEIGIPYATTALATDYDCWKDEEQVSMELVMQTFKENAEKAKAVFVAAVSKIALVDWSAEVTEMKVC